MADSTIAITAGTGTAVDTRTEATNGHHRQVIVIGDPSTNAGVAPVDATAGLKVDLGADNDVTVTGTVDLGATDNAVLDAIEADTTTIAGDTTSIDAKIPALGQALAAASVPVVLTAAQLTTLTPPAAITGFATSAKQDTIIGHVDGIETSLSSIDGKITAVNTGAVVVSSSALPSGASTAAKQPALGTAGTASADVITVQGIASMTALKVDGSAVTQPVSATDLDIRPLVNTDVVTAELSAVDNAVLDTIAAKDFATQTTLSAMNAKMVSGTDIGDVTVNNASGASAVNIQDGGNTITVDGTVAVTNSDITSIKTAVEIIDNAVSGNEMQVDVVGALPAGTNTIGAVKSVPSDIDSNGSNANHADKYYTNAGAVTDGIIWSPAAGKRWHVLNLTINVSAACTVTIEDDLAAGDNPRLKFEFAANSGITIPYNKEHPFSSGEDAADLLITTTAGNVYVQAVGYEI